MIRILITEKRKEAAVVDKNTEKLKANELPPEEVRIIHHYEGPYCCYDFDKILKEGWIRQDGDDFYLLAMGKGEWKDHIEELWLDYCPFCGRKPRWKQLREELKKNQGGVREH